MKTYHDIVGDGGSNVLGQVEAQQSAIREALSGVRHSVAVGSGKGGVGKSTVTMALAKALRSQGKAVAVLDADFNGPCQAQLAGLHGAAPWVPGENGLVLPRNRDGIGVASFGSLLPEAQPFEVESVAENEEQTWRSMREFALLGQLLGSVEWGKLDVLLFDLPPGTERTRQYSQFFGAETAFVLVTIPSDLAYSVVARSVSALAKTSSPLLGIVENMAGYYCRDCGEVRPLYPRPAGELKAPCLGSIPFDPAFAALSRDEGQKTDHQPATGHAVDEITRRLLEALESQP